MTPQPTRPTARFDILRPNRPLIATPTSGSTGMRPMSFSIAASPPEEIDLVDVGRVPEPEQGDDDREARGGFRGGERHDEEDVDLGLGSAGDPCEGDERQVPRVEHELDAHEDRDRAAAHQDADHPEREEHRGEDENEARVDHDSLFLARSTAPTMATMSRSEIASNG